MTYWLVCSELFVPSLSPDGWLYTNHHGPMFYVSNREPCLLAPGWYISMVACLAVLDLRIFSIVFGDIFITWFGDIFKTWFISNFQKQGLNLYHYARNLSITCRRERPWAKCWFCQRPILPQPIFGALYTNLQHTIAFNILNQIEPVDAMMVFWTDTGQIISPGRDHIHVHPRAQNPRILCQKYWHLNIQPTLYQSNITKTVFFKCLCGLNSLAMWMDIYDFSI